MPLVAFFIAVHTRMVLFQCVMLHNIWHLGGMTPLPLPKSALGLGRIFAFHMPRILILLNSKKNLFLPLLNKLDYWL